MRLEIKYFFAFLICVALVIYGDIFRERPIVIFFGFIAFMFAIIYFHVAYDHKELK